MGRRLVRLPAAHVPLFPVSLEKRQRPDGSFLNRGNGAFGEDTPTRMASLPG
jgi:hypothetical protein